MILRVGVKISIRVRENLHTVVPFVERSLDQQRHNHLICATGCPTDLIDQSGNGPASPGMIAA